MNQVHSTSSSFRNRGRSLRNTVAWLTVLASVAVGCRPEPVADPSKDQKPAKQTSQVVADATQEPEVPKESAPLDLEPLLEEQELQEGWIALFDGKTLFGWEAIGEADWQVVEGAIQGKSASPAILHGTTRFGDFQLKLEYRVDPDTACNLIFRERLEPEDSAADQVVVDLVPPLPDDAEAGQVDPTANSESLGVGQWHGLQVDRQGTKLAVQMRGRTHSYEIAEDAGPVFSGVQLHKGAIAVRRVMLRPLGMTSLFNGRDLEGWKTYPEMASRFTVTDEGYMNVQDGRGQLETVKRYDDFVLQLECISHAAGLNSGIFFRCIPGEQMNGYESQIHNAFEAGDRSRPVDCGTGGIFRRQDARYVVADDLQWFTKTIVADGPHITVWVNGLQVTDWMDTRPADPNPRRGLRTEPGTIMIQGHDPTTNLSFRNLRIGELSP